MRIAVQHVYIILALLTIPINALLEVQPGTVGNYLLNIGIALLGIVLIYIGYVTELGFGGGVSIGAAKVYAKITRSHQRIEATVSDDNHSLLGRYYTILVPFFVFLLSFSLSYDISSGIKSGSDPIADTFKWLNIFPSLIKSTPIAFTVRAVLGSIVLIAITGTFVALALPYLKRLRVTTMNGSSFHLTILLAGIGILGGLGIVLSASGFVYSLLTGGIAALRYSFAILFESSLFYSAGLLLGLDKATGKIKTRLKKFGPISV